MIETPKIYEAISNVMAEIGAVGKNKKNTQGQGFMYRGIDDVMNALQPALIKNKVFVTPTVRNEIREERQSKQGGVLLYTRLTIDYTFYTVDGSSVTATVIGEAMDSGDKATNKAMSIGFKYACFQTFCIPTEEMIDPDSETHKVAPDMVDSVKIQLMKETIEKKGIKEDVVLKTYGKTKFEDFTVSDFVKCMKRLEVTPDKQ